MQTSRVTFTPNAGRVSYGFSLCGDKYRVSFTQPTPTPAEVLSRWGYMPMPNDFEKYGAAASSAAAALLAEWSEQHNSATRPIDGVLVTAAVDGDALVLTGAGFAIKPMSEVTSIVTTRS